MRKTFAGVKMFDVVSVLEPVSGISEVEEKKFPSLPEPKEPFWKDLFTAELVRLKSIG